MKPPQPVASPVPEVFGSAEAFLGVFAREVGGLISYVDSGERIRAAFGTPFEWKGTEVRCGASVGVSLYPDNARDPAALLASADAAMYRVKTAR